MRPCPAPEGENYIGAISEIETVGDNMSSIPDYIEIRNSSGQPSLDELLRFYLNSKLIVTNPDDPIYAQAGTPNPPVGSVFLGATQGETPLPVPPLDTPGAAWTAIILAKLYQRTGNEVALQLATSIGNYLLSLIIDADFYGSPFKLMLNRMVYENNQWTKELGHSHVRTQYHTIWALMELYSITSNEIYANSATELLKTVGLVYNNINSRAGTEIATWMSGAVYNTFNQISDNKYALSWNVFSTTTGDMLCRALQKYIELKGNLTLQDPQGTSFTPQDIIDGYHNWLLDCYNNHGLLMSSVQLCYGFYHYNWNDPQENGLYIPQAKNWDWINNIWGDVWWTSDLQMWGIIGFALMGENNIANFLKNKLLELAVPGEQYLFYDRYNYDGSSVPKDLSISICVTGLLYTLERILNNQDLLPQLQQILLDHMIQDTSQLIDGGFPWDVSIGNANLEVKTTGEILLNAFAFVFESTAAFLSPKADGLKDCWIDQRLNAECTLTFLLPMTSEKWSELTAECRIRAGGREFVILHSDAIDIERDDQGKVWGKVTAQESWVLLNKQYPTITNIEGETPADLSVTIVSGGTTKGGYSAGSAGNALAWLLEGSGWTVGTVDVTGTHDLETEKESLLANIQKVQEIWGGYLVWDSINKTVSLRAEDTWQNYTGFQVRYAKNMKSITRTANHDIVTRLYPFGENDLDIASVNGGVKYLENYSYTSNVYVGIYQNQDIADPQELKDKATEVLAKICKPRYTYRVRLVDLRTLPEYSHEDFALGDMADVIDEDLEINVRARIVRHKYNVFQPWQCELEIGEPEDRLVARLAESWKTADFVKNLLKPNPATKNILKGVINTFATLINSANGKLVWNDSTLEAIEIDEAGNETGNRVRITPGGIGVSTDGGQTYDTAMTGLGVLANKVIVNELYALATDDGHTKLEASGLHVYDESAIERLIAGWWMDGATKRFGLNVKAQDGQTTLLDDRGILQTWQIQHADNLDSNHPLKIIFYIPPEANLGAGKRFKLSFTREWFRAYETGAASGGGSTRTSTSAGEHRHKVFEWIGGVWDDPLTLSTNTAGSHNHSINVNDGGNHQHRYWDEPVGANYTDYAGTHDHSASSGYSGSHGHNFTIPYIKTFRALKSSSGNDFWNVGIGAPDYEDIWTFGAAGDHNHTVTIPDHTHELIFGIYESTAPTDITITIDGQNVTDNLGGPFNENKTDLDLSPFITSTGWHTLELGSATLGRLNASLFIQVFMHV